MLVGCWLLYGFTVACGKVVVSTVRLFHDEHFMLPVVMPMVSLCTPSIFRTLGFVIIQLLLILLVYERCPCVTARAIQEI